MSTIVKTQQELDAALADGKAVIIIDSPRGVWLTVSDSATVRASGSATVGASGSDTVEASGPATWCDLNGIDVTEDGRAS